MIYKAKPQNFVKLSLELCWKLDGFLKGAGKYDTKVCKIALLWLPQEEAQSLETSPTAKSHQRTQTAITPTATCATSQSWAGSYVKKYTIGAVLVLEGGMGTGEIFQELCYPKFIENNL